MDNVNISVMVQDKVINVSVLTDTNWAPTDDSVSLRVQTLPTYLLCDLHHKKFFNVIGLPGPTSVFCYSGVSVRSAAAA